MERKFNVNGIDPGEAATLAGMGEAVEHREAAAEVGERFRRYLGTAWSFTRHLMEMVVAMIAGMVVLGVALWVLGDPSGEVNLLVEYALMGAFMSAPMVAWMRYRGHAWSDGLEMTAAMLFPMFALVLTVELGVVELTSHSLMMLSHVAMIGGMGVLMIYRWDRYTHKAHNHHEKR